MTGVPVAFIERFVGPVLAERAYIVESALAVRLPPETEGARSRTFGAVMGERLDALAAKDVRWTSAKEPSGWVLAVAFVADDVQHAARWRFDAKHMRLDARQRRGVDAVPAGRARRADPAAPRHRADRARHDRPAARAASAGAASRAAARRPRRARRAAEPDRTRFDSAAFRFPSLRRSGRKPEAPAEPQPASSRPRTRARPRAPADRAAEAPGATSCPRAPRASASPPRGREPLPPTRAMDVVDQGDVFAPRRARPARARRAP